MAVDHEVSIVMPIYNASDWLEEALQSVLQQSFTGSLELSVFNDASTDSSIDIVRGLVPQFEARRVTVTIGDSDSDTPRGVGYARNQAIKQSSGKYLCIFDADDVMLPNRIRLQHQLACRDEDDALVGAQFKRSPEGSMDRYTRWCNSLTLSQLYTQAYTSFGPTIIQPTWFLSRRLYDRIGPFDERGKGTPEDLLFFYKIVFAGVRLSRVDEVLLVYRYHGQNTTSSIEELSGCRNTFRAMFPPGQGDNMETQSGGSPEPGSIKMAALHHLECWQAGAKTVSISLTYYPRQALQVIAFCDVDEKKLAKKFYTYEDSEKTPKPQVPIVDYRDAQPPFLLCVKWDLTGGEFEKNLASLQLTEGQDFYNFS